MQTKLIRACWDFDFSIIRQFVSSLFFLARFRKDYWSLSFLIIDVLNSRLSHWWVVLLFLIVTIELNQTIWIFFRLGLFTDRMIRNVAILLGYHKNSLRFGVQFEVESLQVCNIFFLSFVNTFSTNQSK